MLWHIGNTTVRTPYRLQEALKLLSVSPLNGNLSGNDQEQAFAEFLHTQNIVDVGRIERGEDASDVGRKWRVALSQLGFISPQLTRNIPNGDVDPKLVSLCENIGVMSGRQYEVTPNGLRLAQSETLAAQQECFLRSLAGYQIPSPLETRYKCSTFSPLQFVLEILHQIREAGENPKVSFQEFALYVQTVTADEKSATAVASEIIAFRKAREGAAGNVRAFDRARYADIATAVKIAVTTLDDYADLTFRYLKATGLFRDAGRGITTTPNKSQLAELIRTNTEIFEDGDLYLKRLWSGAELPTDNEATARVVVSDLSKQLSTRGVEAPEPNADIALPDLQIVRYDYEEKLQQLDEAEFANDQANHVDEIAAWMDALAERASVKLPNGETIKVPKGEAPAYLEWAIWRAFLAINSLTIAPWEARNFKIDQDFLPVHCAPGGRPDMVFEFDNTIVVVEVTLTSSSRQEAAEGEPVRRHVAQYAEKTKDKKVFGLFIAVDIDSNTAHTFSAGAWYLADDSKISLDIVPLRLEEFKRFLLSGKSDLNAMPKRLRDLLTECRSVSNRDAPLWKQEISQIVDSAVK